LVDDDRGGRGERGRPRLLGQPARRGRARPDRGGRRPGVAVPGQGGVRPGLDRGHRRRAVGGAEAGRASRLGVGRRRHRLEEDVWALAITYWTMATDELLAWSEADEGSIGHGGEWETSLQLYLRGELVDMNLAVKDEWRTKFGEDVRRYARFPERRREMAHGV